MKNTIKTIDGWVQVKNSFVKKVGENLFDVVRIEDSDNGSGNIYYENYNKVSLNDATEEIISRHGNYAHFLKLKTDEEKIAYTAFSGFNPCESSACESYEEITNILQEDGVIDEGQKVAFAMIM